MPSIAFVNGRFMPIARAKVSVEDRGYQFGDGIYEVIQTYGGKIFGLDQHLARLERSAAEINLRLPYAGARWRRIIEEAHRRSRFARARIYIQVTRGAAPRNHEIPKRAKPTVVVTVRAYQELAPRVRREGVAVITLEDIRWGRCDIKSINLLANVLSKQRARSEGALEGIFIRNGWVMEGTSSNIFAVINEALVTPPKSPFLLSGITREVVLRLAEDAGYKVEERNLSLEELNRATEVFLSGTSVEVLAVIRIDGRTVGSGRPGPCSQRLYALYRKAVQGAG